MISPFEKRGSGTARSAAVTSSWSSRRKLCHAGAFAGAGGFVRDVEYRHARSPGCDQRRRPVFGLQDRAGVRGTVPGKQSLAFDLQQRGPDVLADLRPVRVVRALAGAGEPVPVAHQLDTVIARAPHERMSHPLGASRVDDRARAEVVRPLRTGPGADVGCEGFCEHEETPRGISQYIRRAIVIPQFGFARQQIPDRRRALHVESRHLISEPSQEEGHVKRPAFWIVLGLASIAAAGAAWHFFPQAFSIVALDITMDREAALTAARSLATRDGLGPAGYRQAASFTADEEAQTFVELEGGGKEALTRMLRDGLFFTYTWRVRHFREGETNETLFRFTPDGRPYGFSETLNEDAPGAALDAAAARGRAEADARARWQIDFATFASRRAGSGAAARRARRSHADLRTCGAGAERGALPRPPRRLRRSPHGSHALHPDPRSVHAALPEHAIGERGHRHRVRRRHDASVRRRRHRRRLVLHAAQPVGAVAGGGGVGRGGRAAAGARHGQRVAADVDDLRHGRAARDVPRASRSRRSSRCSRASPSSSACRSWRRRP